ncbi:unnamed protein product [Callosobruchus maculatus]|uniref:S1 motif domain-containing protein n=1 Tax=Callosobruchus maculatus TaxID=64391 RepID=A0A653CWL0_CALMS|nr:unnamed protein product [Callosobruchus maculatus]
MYQHDLKKKSIEEALEEVVSECVSFIGVDLNTASHSLLRRVAGLTEKRATSILKFREENGPFCNREQLNKVTGIGPKVFKQCAGFLRVGPTDAKTADNFYKKPKTTKLDCTYVHPESYDIASKLMKKLKLQPINIGEDDFIDTIKSCENKIQDLSNELNCSLETMKLIVEALSKPLNYDLRSDIPQRQIFRKEIANINDLTTDTVITGRVSNVTHFGCFVDIGVGKMGLIHVSKMNGLHLQVGDKVEVKVLNVDIARGRISLQAVSLMMNGID